MNTTAAAPSCGGSPPPHELLPGKSGHGPAAFTFLYPLNQLTLLMSKRKSLKRIGAFIEDRAKLESLLLLLSSVVDDDRASKIELLGNLALYQEEITFHRHKLKEAIKICEYGLDGTQPLVAKILDRPPGKTLSQGLLWFIDTLPSMLDEGHRSMVEQRDVFDFFEGKSDEEAHQQNLAGHRHNIELTLFAQSYADDLLKANELAESGGEFSAIRKLLL